MKAAIFVALLSSIETTVVSVFVAMGNITFPRCYFPPFFKRSPVVMCRDARRISWKWLTYPAAPGRFHFANFCTVGFLCLHLKRFKRRWVIAKSLSGRGQLEGAQGSCPGKWNEIYANARHDMFQKGMMDGNYRLHGRRERQPVTNRLLARGGLGYKVPSGLVHVCRVWWKQNQKQRFDPKQASITWL